MRIILDMLGWIFIRIMKDMLGWCTNYDKRSQIYLKKKKFFVFLRNLVGNEVSVKFNVWIYSLMDSNVSLSCDTSFYYLFKHAAFSISCTCSVYCMLMHLAFIRCIPTRCFLHVY